jgi:hypothetical protein
MMNHLYGNKKQNQEDNDNAEHSLITPGVCATESQIACQRLVLSVGSESPEAGEAKETQAAILAAIRREEEEPHEETLRQIPAPRGTDPVGTARRTFHEPHLLS